MADIRCPMCSKINPEEREECQYCGARLTPVRPTPPPASGAGGDDLPDWLRSFRTSDDASSAGEAGGLPDWLSGSPSPGIEPEEDVPEWLAGLRSREESQPTPPESESEPEPDPEVEAEPPAEQDLPGWLSPTPMGEDEPINEPPDTEDWLASFAPTEPEPLDWMDETLTDASQAQPEPEADMEASPPAPDDQETPIVFEPASEAEVAPDPEPQADDEPQPELEPPAEPGAEDEQPEWLRSLWASPESSLPDEAETEPPVPDADALPSWLDSFKSEPDPEPLASAVEPEPEAEPPAEGDMPTWLAELTTDSDEDFLPSWMRRGEAAAPAGEEPASSEEESSEPEASAFGPSSSFILDSGDDEDWLKDFQADDTESPDLPSGAAAFTLDEDAEAELEPLLGGDLPDWLANIRTQGEDLAPVSSEGDTGLSAFDEDEPFEASGAAVFDVPEPSGSEIAPAHLPSWLEAMRPIDASSQVQDDSPAHLESAGPLAGIPGVLPAEPEVSRTGKSAGLALKLQVSEAQEKNAALFEELIKAEDQAAPVTARRRIAPQSILRMLVGLVLFLAVIIPLAFGTGGAPAPAAPLPAALTAYQLINQVPVGAPVLVAFDYDPGWSGEMDALAAPIIDNLMQRGAHLVIVSTSPTGPAQAERVLGQVNRYPDRHLVYQPRQQYSNLGFIPGGPAGLLAFAQTPRLVMPGSGFNTPSAWDHPALLEITRLDQFQMALVFTENPETARAWLEQVQPVLGTRPLVMAVSAQADPLVRPYYSAGANQLAGLLSGLEGGLHYENMTGRMARSHQYWGAYSLGLFAAAGLILLGGLFNAVSGMLERRKMGDFEG